MDTFGSATKGEVMDVPEQLRTLFNSPDDVKVEKLPCALPGLGSMAVRFAAGARTVPHVHHGGQHLVFVEGSGVVGDDNGVHVVHTGDVVSSPPDGWHWHGALLKVDRQRIGVGSGLARRARLVAGTGLLVGGEEVVMLPAGG